MSGMTYEYALIRAVPRVDRGEAVNVGVILYCQDAGLLICRVHVDPDRLRALWADADVETIADAVAGIEHACMLPAEGSLREGGGLGARFRWLTAPRSTAVQPGPVHAGVTSDPAAEADRLLDRLVR